MGAFLFGAGFAGLLASDFITDHNAYIGVCIASIASLVIAFGYAVKKVL